MRAHCAAGLFLLLVSAAAQATQAPKTNVGVLTCTLEMSSGTRSGKMSCGFKPAREGPEEQLTGRIEGFQGPGGKLVLVWAVLASGSTKVTGQLLAQKYARGTGVLGQPPVWQGQASSEVALQFETNSGVDVARTIGEIELQVAGTRA